MIKPKFLDIEVTTACMFKCVGCPVVTNPKENVGHMDVDLFKSIVDRAKVEVPEARFVPWLLGEPLLHPRYLEMIKYVDEAGFKYYITTNGMIYNEELFKYITCPESNCYQIIFSLDGLPVKESRSIEIARPGSDRGKILSTINRFGMLKLAVGSKMDMAVKICDRGQDYEEVENYIYYWLQYPFIDYVVSGKLLTVNNTGGMRMYPCRYADNQFMVIKWDGDFVACGYCLDAHNNRKLTLGKVDKTTPLMEIYNNPVATEFRENQRKGIWHPVCKECGFSYSGYGFDGIVEFKDPEKKKMGKLHTSNDYYNIFYSRLSTWEARGK